MVSYLIGKHYTACSRPLRRCHARDLLEQILHYCEYNELQLTVSEQHLDYAVRNYFTALKSAQSEQGSSIIVVLATDAPLLPIQCQRLARRATTGLAWVGGIGANGSGDLFIAFSTANHVGQAEKITEVKMLAPDAMTNLLRAAAEATEEAILNALCMAETMTGRNGRTIHALPLDTLQEIMRHYEPGQASVTI